MKSALADLQLADHVLLPRGGNAHFVAILVINLKEALKPAGQRAYQPLVVVLDSLTSAQTYRSDCVKLLKSLTNLIAPTDKRQDFVDSFTILLLDGASQSNGVDCLIFTYLNMIHLVKSPAFFDLAPGSRRLPPAKQSQLN